MKKEEFPGTTGGCIFIGVIILIAIILIAVFIFSGLSALFNTPGFWTGVAVVLGAAGVVLLVWHAAHPN